MKFPVNFFELGIRHMGIDLRGGDRCVPEELLDGTDIGTVGEQGSGETMTKRVSGDIFYNIGTEGVFLNLIGDKKPRESHICVRQGLFYDIISLY